MLLKCIFSSGTHHLADRFMHAVSVAKQSFSQAELFGVFVGVGVGVGVGVSMAIISA